MILLLKGQSTSLHRAGLEIMTALLAAMRVFEQNGLESLQVTRHYHFTDLNDPQKRRRELLEIATDQTAHAERMAIELLEQIDELAYIRTGPGTLTLIGHKLT